VEQVELEQRLRAAVLAGGLTVVYQPVVDLSTGTMVGVEALCRWHDPRLGSVPPDQFIPLAEASGLIVELGRWVLGEACRRAASWSERDGRPVVAVNVSPVQLREPTFVGDVQAALAASGLPAERLCLEITETAMVTDLGQATATLARLRDLGIQLALDDFGTGHSSLTLLRSLPLHTVKIDRSLICSVAADAQEAVLVQLVIDAAHSLGRRVCAEGVEQVAQARQLVAMGCDTGQGWLFGRPASPPTPERPWPSAPAAPQWLESSAGPPVALSGNDDLVLTTDRERLVTYVSASVRRVLGRMPSEVVGRPLRELLGVGHDEGPVTLELDHKEGGVRWLRGIVQPLRDATGSEREVLCVLSDVTMSVQREKALGDSEELFRSAFSGAPIGIALSDFDGRLLRVNPALAELLGHSVEELLQMTVSDITHPDDNDADDANRAEARSGSVTRHRVVKRYLHADGHAVHVEVHAATVESADGDSYCEVAHILPRTADDGG
jgi:PAS domain S-box-containing protein